ncbi:reverse transcriptase domain-containing protein [Tanacetum coccineum]
MSSTPGGSNESSIQENPYNYLLLEKQHFLRRSERLEIKNRSKDPEVEVGCHFQKFQDKAMVGFSPLEQQRVFMKFGTPSNTIANPKGDVKAITTRSGVSYNGPQTSSPKETENEPEVTKDTVQPSTENIQPPVVQTHEPVVVPKTKPTLPYPTRANQEKFREKDNLLASKFMEIFRNLHFELSFADALLHMPKFAPMFRKLLNDKDKIIELTKTPVNENCSAVILKKFPEKLGDPVGDTKTLSYNIIETVNRVDVIDIACEEYVQEVLETSESGNPTSTSDLTIDSRSPSLTPFGGSDFLMEEIDEFLENDDSIPPGVDGIYDSEGDTVYLEELLSVINSDPNLPPSPVCEINVPEKVKSSCEDPPDLELKDLPSHLEYAFLEGDDKLPVIIAKNLKDEDKTALIKVLKSHKRAIAWKISDIKGIDPQFCTHKILMEENAKPVVQHQRRVNPKIHEVIKQEVIKLLDAGLIYPISDSPWVSPVHCVPKKGGITVVKNEDNELIPTRLVTGWRVCIDYRKLNDATRKDHFPLPFMDQMLERLAGNEYYCFLETDSPSYFQIQLTHLTREDHHHRPLRDMKEQVLGHKISKSGIEVDKAKVDVIAKLPHPTTVKGIFPKIARPITHLLEKETPFIFSKDCIEAFETLKMKLTQAPILVAPDWDLPFEIMCDASDFAVGAVLGHWGIDVNGPFPASKREQIILVAVITYQNGFEAKALPTNDAQFFCKFLNLLLPLGAPPCIISDRGTHFCHDYFSKVMDKYGVTHLSPRCIIHKQWTSLKYPNRGFEKDSGTDPWAKSCLLVG